MNIPLLRPFPIFFFTFQRWRQVDVSWLFRFSYFLFCCMVCMDFNNFIARQLIDWCYLLDGVIPTEELLEPSHEGASSQASSEYGFIELPDERPGKFCCSVCQPIFFALVWWTVPLTTLLVFLSFLVLLGRLCTINYVIFALFVALRAVCLDLVTVQSNRFGWQFS